LKIINDSIFNSKLPVMFLKLKLSERSTKISKTIAINRKLYSSIKFQSNGLESNGYHKRVY
jgi:hypothetical protein